MTVMGGYERLIALSKGEIEHLINALPPGRDVLKVSAQAPRQRPVQPEPDVLRIADDAGRQPSLQLVRGLSLAAAKGAVDPQEHS